MELQSFPTPMHPKGEHNYTIDYSALFDGLGGDSIVGIPTLTIDAPVPTPPGLTVTFVSLDTDAQVVNFLPLVGAASQGDDAYKFGGVTVCITCIVTTVGGNIEPQQVHLTISDQCAI